MQKAGINSNNRGIFAVAVYLAEGNPNVIVL